MAWWQHTPWRMIQTNLRQTDMLDIDAQTYVRDAQSFHATVIMINAGGIIASYQTSLPYQSQSPYLGQTSLLDIREACRKAGIRVIARMDFSKIRQEMYERYPAWAFLNSAGGIAEYNGDVQTCVCGGYQQDAAFHILEEVIQTLSPDGLYLNMGGFQATDYSGQWQGFCHCDACRSLFENQFGYAIPETADMNSIAYRSYRAFQAEIIAEYHARLVRRIRAINPDIAINEEDFYRLESSTEYGRPLPRWQYSAASNVRCLLGTGSRIDKGHARVASNACVDFVGYRYRHVSVSPMMQKHRLWQSVANLGGLDYYMMGRADQKLDRTAFQAVREVFAYHRENQQEYHSLRSRAQALVVRNHAWVCTPEERGWISALSQNHILFHECLAHELQSGDFTGYQAVILPQTEALPRAIATGLDTFAQAGGIVLVSGGLVRFNEHFTPQECGMLRCLGVTELMKRWECYTSAMLTLNREDKASLPSFEDCDVIMTGDWFEVCQYQPPAQRIGSLLPPQPFGPPERCYPQQEAEPFGIMRMPYGKGAGIHIPFALGQLYTQEGYDNTVRLLRDVLLHLCGLRDMAPFETPMLEVTIADTADGSGMLIHLINGTGHCGASFFNPVPLRNLRISLPCTQQIARAYSLVTGAELEIIEPDHQVHVENLQEFEAIKLNF